MTPAGRPDQAERSDRGQLLVLAALVLAVLFVSLAVIVNAATYTESLAVQKDGSAGDAIQTNQRAVEATGNHIAYVNRNHNASHRTLGENFTANVGDWNRATQDRRVKRGTHASVSILSIRNRTVVVHDDESRQFTNATGAENWTLAGGVESVPTFRMEVHDDAIIETGGDRPFRVLAQNGTTWEMEVTKDTGSGEIEIAVTDGDGTTETCVTSGPTAQLDLVAGTVDGVDCPGLELGTGVAEPYTLTYENGEHARGDYDLTVLTSNRVDNGQYHAETGSPRATYAIGTATVAYTYQTGDIKHTATVVVSPDE